MRLFARSIVDTVRHPLLVLDADLRVVSANPPFYHAFDTTARHTVGEVLFDLNGGSWNIPRLRSHLLDVIPQNGSFADLEVKFESSSLGQRVMILNGCRVTNDADGTPMILLAIEDITERRRSRNELTQSNAELEDKIAQRTTELEKANREMREGNRELAAANRELEAFCYSVSHDLRAPLRAVDGFSQELLQEYVNQLDDKGKHYLHRVRAGTQRMGQLIDDLLKLSQVTRVEMRRENVNLTGIAENVVADLREREPARAVSFNAPKGLTAVCDPRLIRVVLDNLLGNAWKFTAKKPEATVLFDRIEVAGRPAFVVRDDGAGFDMAYARRLFGAFQRLHSDREFPGTGIGLATVQRVVQRHGGEVWAEGAVGRGAAFFFTFPGSNDG